MNWKYELHLLLNLAISQKKIIVIIINLIHNFGTIIFHHTFVDLGNILEKISPDSRADTTEKQNIILLYTYTEVPNCFQDQSKIVVTL